MTTGSAPPPRAALAAPRILVADDSAALRTVVRLTVESQGWTVLEASCGAQTLALIASEAPELVLLDLNFGDDGPDGLEVLAALRAAPSTEAVPVVLLTASDDPSVPALAAALGAGHLSKPFGPLDLIELLRHELAATLRPAQIGLHRVQAGALRPGDLERALEEQARQRRDGSAPPLGELLVEDGAVTRPDLSRALRDQRLAKRPGCSDPT